MEIRYKKLFRNRNKYIYIYRERKAFDLSKRGLFFEKPADKN